jgi:hypothetical protein
MNKGLIKNKIKSTLRVLVLITITLVPQSSCELLDIITVDCAECYTDYPYSEELSAEITINSENQAVPITVFYGPFENNDIAFRDTSIKSIKYLWLDTGVDYTIRAEYTKNGRTFYVINGAKLTPRKDTDSCNAPCYYVTGKKVDLRLKF